MGLALLLPTDRVAPRPARWLLLGLWVLGALGAIAALVITGLHLGEIVKDGVCQTVRLVVQVATLLSVTVPCRIRPEAYLGLRLLPLALGLLLFAAARLLVREIRGRRARD